MRRAFAEILTELASRDPRILLLTGDLGFMALEPFANAYPDRFFDMGVAEQNMVGVATGLAEAGFIPFVYSIVTFAVLRPFEFIRNGPIAHRLPVRIVGMGGGFEYGTNGISHYGLEDIGVLRTQPSMTIVCPSDAGQTRSALAATWEIPGPVYYRLGKDDRIVVPGLNGRFELGRGQIVWEGDDLLFIATGTAATEAVNAARELADAGIGCTVLLVSSFNPGPRTDLLAQLERFDTVITVETHYTTGGLGSWVAEVIAESNIQCRLIRHGVKEFPDSNSGSQAYLHDLHGIASSHLVREAREIVGAARAART
jgi:transketolase